MNRYQEKARKEKNEKLRKRFQALANKFKRELDPRRPSVKTRTTTARRSRRSLEDAEKHLIATQDSIIEERRRAAASAAKREFDLASGNKEGFIDEYVANKMPRVNTVAIPASTRTLPARTVTPKPYFPMDRWEVTNQEHFNLLMCSFLSFTDGEMDNQGAKKLSVRFLSFVFTENSYENFFDQFYAEIGFEMPSMQNLLGCFAKFGWIPKEDKNISSLKAYIKNRYIPGFTVGQQVKYRKLDQQGKVDLVDGTIITSVYQGILGAYYILLTDGTTEDTTVDRIEPAHDI